MNQRKLTVVGGGQMGRALVGGMLSAGVLDQNQILLVEPDSNSQQWWSEHYPQIRVCELIDALGGSDSVLLAIKPNVIEDVVRQGHGHWREHLVISIAAGVNLTQLSEWIGHHRVARVMPNTPALVGAGASAVCFDQDVDRSDREWIESVLQSVGVVVEVSESQMDAVTGLSGSGPAYVCMMIESLADGGVLAGLPRPLAMQLATQTVLGTAMMIQQTHQHPGVLKDAVASPGGTTIAAIAALEEHGFRGALLQAVAASAARSRELGSK